MQTVTLSEFCRIVKRVSEKSTKGSWALSVWAKTMERVKKLESSTEESLGIKETVCMKSVVRNWRDPTHHRKVKRKRISLAKSYFWWEGVGEEHSTDNDLENISKKYQKIFIIIVKKSANNDKIKLWY